MLEDDLLPSSGEAVEMIALLGLGGVIEWPLQPTVGGSAVTPLVNESFVVVLI